MECPDTPEWFMDPEDPDPATGVFDDRQDVDARAVEEVDGEELGSEDLSGLTTEELRPRWPRTPGRGRGAPPW